VPETVGEEAGEGKMPERRRSLAIGGPFYLLGDFLGMLLVRWMQMRSQMEWNCVEKREMPVFLMI